MAWQEVTTDVGAKAGTTKYSVALKHGGARISVPAALVKSLGWKNGTTFKLMVGGGEQSGKLRLEPAKDGKIAGRQPPNGGEGLIIRLGRWQGLAPRDVDAVAVECDVEGSALIVTLPQHARNEAPPAKPPAGVTMMPAGPSIPTGTKVDVTSRFFDDPKRPVAMASGTRNSRST